MTGTKQLWDEGYFSSQRYYHGNSLLMDSLNMQFEPSLLFKGLISAVSDLKLQGSNKIMFAINI